MKPHVRAAVAAIALADAGGRKVSSVYDYSTSVYRNIDARVEGDRVTGYDYTAGCHVDGNIPNIYHYGESQHIELKRKGDNKYEGYDYGSSCHYSVTVRGNSADVYDCGESSYFNYSR